MIPSRKNRLWMYYERMAAHFEATHWWPGDSPFEIAIGAILTQNTAWSNVEKAIEKLKQAKLLTPDAMVSSGKEQLEEALRPSGYFRVKAERVRAFCKYLLEVYGASTPMARMAARDWPDLRRELLALNGIGPETADDILLYACDKPVFVVDAYTHRIFGRHGFVPHNIKYEELRAFFERHIAPDVHTYKEYHGLIVWTGKEFCRRSPKCAQCPLAALLPGSGPILEN